MSTKAKLIRTLYLYLAALISLLFIAVGTGRLINTGLKMTFFPEAEKRSYYECNQMPPYSGGPEIKRLEAVATEDQKAELQQFLRDYENWKENSQGEKCVRPMRENELVDAITMIIVALPICLLHWWIIRRDKEEKDSEK